MTTNRYEPKSFRDRITGPVEDFVRTRVARGESAASVAEAATDAFAMKPALAASSVSRFVARAAQRRITSGSALSDSDIVRRVGGQESVDAHLLAQLQDDDNADVEMYEQRPAEWIAQRLSADGFDATIAPSIAHALRRCRRSQRRPLVGSLVDALRKIERALGAPEPKA